MEELIIKINLGIIILKETIGVKIRRHHHHHHMHIINKRQSTQLRSSKNIKEEIRVVVTFTLQAMALISRKVVQVRGQHPRFQVIQQVYKVMAIINQNIAFFQKLFLRNLRNKESELKNFPYN